MDRRSLLRRAAGLPALALVPLLPALPEPRRRHGLVDVLEDPAYAGSFRCFVDGREVTDHCFRADDREGWADVYKLRDGRPYAEAGRLPTERVYGRVELRPHGQYVHSGSYHAVRDGYDGVMQVPVFRFPRADGR